MTTRRAHLVGSWVGRSPEQAMENALRELGPYLDRMTDGETGDRTKWVGPPIDLFRVNPDVEMVHDGGNTDYDDVARWRVKDGVTMNPDNVRLRYSEIFASSFESFKVLRERYGRGDLRFQVGIPAPMDIALYTFGEVVFSEPQIVEACTAAALREMSKIFAAGGDDVVFQLETVVSLVGVAQAPDGEQEAMAAGMAAGLLDVVARSPDGARFGFHLCVGDFHHKAYGTMRDVRPLVLLANAIAASWPAGRHLDYIHGPFAAGAEPPPTEEPFYKPLGDLRLPEEVRFIAGFLHETLDLEEHRELLARIEQLTGRRVDVANACGLHEPTPADTFKAMHAAAALIDSTTAGAA